MSAQTAKLISLFNLPPSTPSFINSFHCAYIDGSLPFQGTLYLFPHHLCFLSTLVPLYPQKLTIPLREVRQVRKEKALGLPTALSLHTVDKIYHFTSFINREKCYQWIDEHINQQQRGEDGEEEAGDEEEEAREGQDEADLSLEIASEEEEIGEDDEAEGKVKKSPRPRKPPHKRILSSSYRAGERFHAGVNSPTADEAAGGISKKERVMQKAAQKVREQKEAELQSARDQSRKDKVLKVEKARDEMIARLSPMNLVKSRAQREKEEREKKREEWERDTESEEEPQRELEEEEEEEERPRGKVKKPVVKQEEEKVAEEEAIDDENSSEYVPPQSQTLYQPRHYTAADPLVTAIALRFSSLTVPLDTKNRRFLHEGEVMRQGRFSVVKRRMFLFSDKLLLAKVQGMKLQMKQQMNLDGMTIDIRPWKAQRKECMDTRLPEPFRVLFVKKGKLQSIILSVEGKEARKEWVKKIQLAVSRVQWARSTEEGKTMDWGWYMRIVRGSVHLAALENAEAEMKEMIEKDSTLKDERDQEGLSPLMIAAHLNHSAIVSLLLEKGCKMDLMDADARTAIHIAAKLGYAESVQRLLKEERLDCRTFHPKSGRLSTSSALWMAALAHRGEYEECMRALVAKCRQQKWPSASSSALLDQRDIEDHTLLEVCTSLSLVDVIPILISLSATLDLVHPSLHLTPLCLAAQQTDMESLTALIQLGAQPNWRDAKSGAAVIHYAATLEIASFLVAHGARMTMKTKEGIRITDIYAEQGQLQTLQQAEQFYLQRKPVESTEERKGRPRSISANGGHALDSCFVCQESLGGFGGMVSGMMKARTTNLAWCARCGLIMCHDCLRQKLIFRSDDTEEIAAVCCGCFNVCMYAEETEDRKKRRIERQKRAAEEEKRSLFTSSGINFEMLTSALTEVHISQRAVISSDHATILQPHQMFGQMKIQESITAPTVNPPVTSSSSSPARRSPQPASAAPHRSSIGPASNANLAGKGEKLVNYNTGGVMAVKGRRNSQLALNNSPAVDPSELSPMGSSPGKKGGGGGGMRASASMDGVSERHGKKGGKAVKMEDEEEEWEEVRVEEEEEERRPHPVKGKKRGGKAEQKEGGGKAEPKEGRKKPTGRVKEEKEDEDEEEEVQEEKPSNRKVAVKKGKSTLSVDVEEEEEGIENVRPVKKLTGAPRKITQRHISRVDEDFT